MTPRSLIEMSVVLLDQQVFEGFTHPMPTVGNGMAARFKVFTT